MQKNTCHRCKMNVEVTRTCEICKRFVCLNCLDVLLGMCIDCTRAVSHDPEGFMLCCERTFEEIQLDIEEETLLGKAEEENYENQQESQGYMQLPEDDQFDLEISNHGKNEEENYYETQRKKREFEELVEENKKEIRNRNYDVFRMEYSKKFCPVCKSDDYSLTPDFSTRTFRFHCVCHNCGKNWIRTGTQMRL